MEQWMHTLRRFSMNATSNFKARCAFIPFPVIGFAIMIVSFTAFSQKWQVLTLEDCIKTALEKSPALKVAKEKIVESTAKVKETKTYFLPKFTATALITQLDEPVYLDMARWYDAIAQVDSLVWYLGYKDLLTTGDSTVLKWLEAQGEQKSGSTKYPLSGDKVYNMSLTVIQPIFMSCTL